MNVAKWGQEVDHNLFVTGLVLDAGHFGAWGEKVKSRTLATSDADRTKFATKGCDANSLAGDPQFIDAAKGDFRVKDGSPALKLGFVNFPMDQLGVRLLRLKALADTGNPHDHSWHRPNGCVGGGVSHLAVAGRDPSRMEGLEFSALGVGRMYAGRLWPTPPRSQPR